MNRELLDMQLMRSFDAPSDERTVVIRQAGDLHDSGRFVETHGSELTVLDITKNLSEAPSGDGLVDRWNWWIGALEVAHGGYERFLIRRWSTR